MSENETAPPSLRPATLRLVRDASNWEALDLALDRPFVLDFTHRGSTMRVTIGPKTN